MPSVSFKTLGCRLNQAETAAMRSRFERFGYETVAFGSPCDIAVIHTCTITAAAERDCSKFARYARRHGASRVVLAGCAVERDAEAVRVASGADIVVGQADKLDLPTQLGLGAPALASTHAPMTPRFDATRALLKIQDGCDFRCAYCIVPDTRGGAHSRPLDDILEEAQALVKLGHSELVVTGANIGCYHDGSHGLIDLLEALETIEGIARIRIGSIESTTVEHDVIAFMAQSDKLCNFLHLPLQSGSDSVLARMRRRYRTEAYAATAQSAAAAIHPLGLGSDIITGFPGETDAEFSETIAYVEALPFNNLHVFPYSERPGTPAATMANQIPMELRRERANTLIALGRQKRENWLNSLIGSTVRILIESCNPDGTAEGWSDTYARCRIHLPGTTSGAVVHGTIVAREGDKLRTRAT